MDSVKNASGQLLSIIFVIDNSQNNDSKDILEPLIENISNENLEIVKAATMSLGHICQ